ncbi:MAG TPA: FAD:protein FMN transferase [Phycisphaerae bacterium]|nr:FAD:protein FMN transferase [Phycisphaerae bacterium]
MTSQSTSRFMHPRRKNNPRPPLTLGSLLILAAIPFVARPAVAEWWGDSRPLMGTEISVQLWHDDAAKGQAAVEAVFSEMERINQLMSTYIEDSRISLINREAADRAVPAGKELYGLIVRSLDMSVLTHGAFDITFDSIGQHYDFRERMRPDAATIEEKLDLIDYRLVVTVSSDKSIRFLRPGVRINLGGIAKGYAVERGAGILRELGIRHAIVTAGGDSRLVGDRRGQPWMVGVRDPRKDGEVAIRLPLENEAISTSGDYERYFEEDGKRYHHILQPATGEPASGVHSATIVGPDAVITDALSTSVFIMGVDRGLRLLATLPDYEGIVIDADGQLFYSDGLTPPDNL